MLRLLVVLVMTIAKGLGAFGDRSTKPGGSMMNKPAQQICWGKQKTTLQTCRWLLLLA
jgi:hypothetical protein